jgi:hypothetical protein
MPRSGRIRRYAKDVAESDRVQQLSIILPFIILIVEIILLIHALAIQEMYIIVLTSFLLIISLIELYLVTIEVTDRKSIKSFDRVLTIRLDDFITETKKSNVKEIINSFIERYPVYRSHRTQVYVLSCQILQTHKDELIEKEYYKKINQFLKKTDKTDLSELVSEFISLNPQYDCYALEIHEKMRQLIKNKK